jgi:hypothetical protein
MKREQIVNSLLKEGFSDKTLVKFNDKQLVHLYERIIGEATTKQVRVLSMNNADDAAEVNNLINNPKAVADMKAKGHVEVTKEEKNKISKDSSKKKSKLKKEDTKEEKSSIGLSKEKKKEVIKSDKKGKDVSKKEIKKENFEIKNWVKTLAENNFHSFTSKGEIMELIQSKTSDVEVGSNVKKGHNGIPEFMTYDSIVSAAEPKEKPSPTKTPTKDPGTKQPPKKDPRKTPFQPGPGQNPKPKALKENK